MTINLVDTMKAQLNKEVLKSRLTYLNSIGILIFIIGLWMMYSSYISSFYFMLGFSGFDASWIIRLMYLSIIAVIGGYLTKHAVSIIGVSSVFSIIILLIGLAFLIFTFWTAQVFIEMQYQFNPFTLAGIVFFGIMVAISVFIFGRGVVGLLAIKKGGTVKPMEIPSETLPPQKNLHIDPPPPRGNEPLPFKTCPSCLSMLSPQDIHCMNCGKKVE
jgi:hypothetical protein